MSYGVGVAGLLLFACEMTSSAASFTYSDIVVPGSVFTTPEDISNSGVIVGTFTNGFYVFPTSGFLWSANTGFTKFDVPNANPTFGTEPYSINDSGTVVGSFFLNTDRTRTGFIRTANGNITLIPEMTLVRGINNAGVIAGVAGSSLPAIRAVDGTLTYFSVPGAYAIPEGINDKGVVVGYTDSSGFVRYPDGSLRLLTFPGASFTVAEDINNNNEVVGFYRDGQNRNRGFRWDIVNGFQATDYPTSINTVLFGINDAGVIVGTHDVLAAPEIGFIAVPTATPEPTSGLFLATGVFTLACFRAGRFKLYGATKLPAKAVEWPPRGCAAG